MSIDDPRPELDDIADDDADPVEAVETLFLSALLWGTRTDVERAVRLVAPSDFYRPVAAEVFEIIAELVDAGDTAAHDAPTVLAELGRRGLLTGHRGTRRALTLELAVSAGATGIQATHYGALVIAAAYRRSYRTAAEGITHAADALPEHDLWDYMSRHGWRIKAIRDRLEQLRDPNTPKETP